MASGKRVKDFISSIPVRKKPSCLQLFVDTDSKADTFSEEEKHFMHINIMENIKQRLEGKAQNK